jgi:hypothetical protein
MPLSLYKRLENLSLSIYRIKNFNSFSSSFFGIFLSFFYHLILKFNF